MTYNRDLKDYVVIRPRKFTKEFCQDLIARAESQTWVSHWWDTDASWDQSRNPCGQDITDLDVLEELTAVIKPTVTALAVQNNTEVNTLVKWRIQRYQPGQCLARHTDRHLAEGHTGIPAFSLVVALNDNFRGGDFQFWSTWSPRLEQGSLMVFPSNFLFPHEVTEINEGVRYSLVAWAF